MKRWLSLVLVAAVALGATACTGPSPKPTDAGDQTGAARTATPPPPFTGVRHALPDGDALANDPELYKNVALEKCERTSKGWTAKGTVANPGSAAASYSILVFFTDPQARALDSARTTVTVPAGASHDWTAKRDFSADGVKCVVRAVSDGKSAAADG